MSNPRNIFQKKIELYLELTFSLRIPKMRLKVSLYSNNFLNKYIYSESLRNQTIIRLHNIYNCDSGHLIHCFTQPEWLEVFWNLMAHICPLFDRVEENITRGITQRTSDIFRLSHASSKVVETMVYGRFLEMPQKACEGCFCMWQYMLKNLEMPPNLITCPQNWSRAFLS